jgi:hypothetical protein
MHVRSWMRGGIAHLAGSALEAAVLLAIGAAIVVAVAAWTGGAPTAQRALAARSTGSWIAPAQPAGLTAASQPALGSTVSFDTKYPSNTKNPRIQVLCYQGGELVYGEAGGVTDTFRLGGGGSIWLSNGGAADCTANLFSYGSHAGLQTYNVLASTKFSAAAG